VHHEWSITTNIDYDDWYGPPDLGGLVAVVFAGGLDAAGAVTFAAELRAWAEAMEAWS
jgi:hypothetical protein